MPSFVLRSSVALTHVRVQGGIQSEGRLTHLPRTDRRRKSRNGPVKIVKRLTPQPLTEAQQEALERHRKAVITSQQAERESYYQAMNRDGRE